MEKMRKYILPLLAILGVIVVTLLIFRGCGDMAPEQPITPDKTDSLKAVISEQYERRIDSIIAIKKKDSVRVEYVTRWRKMKGDTAYIPCDSILPKIVNLCDSIIYVDSSQIATMKSVIAMDDSIISNYKKVVENDSITIVGLNKQIKKHKRQKKWLVAGIAATGVVAIIK